VLYVCPVVGIREDLVHVYDLNVTVQHSFHAFSGKPCRAATRAVQISGTRP
jgi:hypothetical protein